MLNSISTLNSTDSEFARPVNLPRSNGKIDANPQEDAVTVIPKASLTETPQTSNYRTANLWSDIFTLQASAMMKAAQREYSSYLLYNAFSQTSTDSGARAILRFSANSFSSYYDMSSKGAISLSGLVAGSEFLLLLDTLSDEKAGTADKGFQALRTTAAGRSFFHFIQATKTLKTAAPIAETSFLRANPLGSAIRWNGIFMGIVAAGHTYQDLHDPETVWINYALDMIMLGSAYLVVNLAKYISPLSTLGTYAASFVFAGADAGHTVLDTSRAVHKLIEALEDEHGNTLPQADKPMTYTLNHIYNATEVLLQRSDSDNAAVTFLEIAKDKGLLAKIDWKYSPLVNEIRDPLTGELRWPGLKRLLFDALDIGYTTDQESAWMIFLAKHMRSADLKYALDRADWDDVPTYEALQKEIDSIEENEIAKFEKSFLTSIEAEALLTKAGEHPKN